MSAVLFGISAPIAKVLGDGLNVWLLAGLLHLGSGAGLAAWRAVHVIAGDAPKQAALTRADARWMAAVIFFGGVARPVLLMFGLKLTASSTASLLLNLESHATMAIAWLVYRENVDRRLLLGALAILAGATVLSWDFSAVAWSGGAALVAAAGLHYFTTASQALLFWAAFILTRPLGATVGDFLDKPLDHGGLTLSRPLASAVLAVVIVACILLFPQRAGVHPGTPQKP
ncbi:MAG: EamA family transporter [Micropepsaceae bacterium]